MYRHWNRLTRWHSLDGYAYGLAIGLGIGRIGCYSVGEHFGSLTSFPLAVRYDGGQRAGGAPRHRPARSRAWCSTRPRSTSCIYMVVLFVLLSIVLYVRKPRPGPGVAMAIFTGFYGVARFLSDSLRVNDETLLGLTGRAVPVPGPAAHQRVDLVPRPPAARRRTSRTACRSAIAALRTGRRAAASRRGAPPARRA